MAFAIRSLVVAAALSVAPAVASSPPAPGDPAPDFALAGSDGKTHRLADHVGKRAVVVAWFPKAFTGGWTAECKSLRESGEAIRAFDVAYYAASVDDADTNRRFAESLSLDFPILSDPDKGTARAFGVVDDERALPRRWTFYIGKDGSILAIDRSVDPATAGEEVARRLGALGVARSGRLERSP